jgi:single-strand DNA-binding protein
MRGLNKVMLIGHLGKDPEIQNFEGGAMLAKFSLATTEAFKDKAGNRQELTEWHNIVVWGSLAEIAQKYLRKGMAIYLEGKIRNRSYDDKEGVKKYITEIRAESFQMLEKKEGGIGAPDANSASVAATTSTAPPINPTVSDNETDDLPF